MSCRMLAEIARRRSRGSKFETKVFVMSRSNFSRSLSRSSSGLEVGDSLELIELFGMIEEFMLKFSVAHFSIERRSSCQCLKALF